MALLQISEPGMSTAPHQHRLAVGIDLGTTNSLVATVRNGVPQCLQDDDGKLLLPSVVHYLPDGQIVVGRKAQATQATDPHYHQHCCREQTKRSLGVDSRGAGDRHREQLGERRQ